MITEERLQEMKRVYNIPGDYEFPDSDSAMMAGDICELIAALSAAQQRLAEAVVRITKLKSFLYSLRDVTTVAGAQIRRIDKIVDEAVDENSK